jgi:hypothetical protein
MGIGTSTGSIHTEMTNLWQKMAKKVVLGPKVAEISGKFITFLTPPKTFDPAIVPGMVDKIHIATLMAAIYIEIRKIWQNT